MKKIFKDWNLFEICFLSISLLTIFFCFIFSSDKSIITLIASLLGVITVLCGAKGLIIAPFINIIYNLIYIFLSFSQKFYGEVIIYVFFMIPLHVITIISWLKNRSKENKNIVSVNKISLKEYIILIIGTIGVSIIFYNILKLLNTNALLISTISLVDSFLASYLLFRRSSNYAFSYIVNDIILIILWMYTIKTTTAYIPIIVSFMIFLINDIYGLISWKKREKHQNK